MNRWIFQVLTLSQRILTQSRRERGETQSSINQKNSAALLLCASALNFPSARRNQWTRL